MFIVTRSTSNGQLAAGNAVAVTRRTATDKLMVAIEGVLVTEC